MTTWAGNFTSSRNENIGGTISIHIPKLRYDAATTLEIQFTGRYRQHQQISVPVKAYYSPAYRSYNHFKSEINDLGEEVSITLETFTPGYIKGYYSFTYLDDKGSISLAPQNPKKKCSTCIIS